MTIVTHYRPRLKLYGFFIHNKYNNAIIKLFIKNI